MGNTYSTNRFSLRFQDKNLEREFLEVYGKASLQQIRYAFMLGIVLYGLFGIRDQWVAGNEYLTLWIIRYAVVCPVGVLIVAGTFIRGIQKHIQWVSSVGVLIASAGILFMFSLAPSLPNDYAYASLMLLLTFGLILARLRFVFAVPVAVIVVAAYQAVVLFVRPLEIMNLVHSDFFLLSAAIIGLYACYVIEFFFRRDYVQARWLNAQAEAIRLANAELQERNTLLAGMNAEKNEFMGIAAHDLKNPLTGIVLALSTISRYTERMTPEEIRRRLHLVENSAERMQGIIENLLDVNAIESGSYNLKPHTFDACEIVRRVCGELEARANTKNICLHYDNLPEQSQVFADPKASTQILENLLSNAIKYSPTEKSVYVRVLNNNSSVRIEIEDEGPGISIEDQKKLFGKFIRLSAKPTGGEHSTGLGLSIAKRLSELMDGSVGCRSILGSGSMFYVELPGSRASEHCPPFHG